jgi:hypothetical protein
MGRRYSVCVDVRWAMLQLKPGEPTHMKNSEGEPMDAAEAGMRLTLHLMRGHKVLPLSRECNNPCEHEEAGCTGFDFAGGGCPGHEVER